MGVSAAVALSVSAWLLGAALDAEAEAPPKAAFDFAVAKRVPVGPGFPSPVRPQLIVGDGWGCAARAGGWISRWQCWDAAPAPRAWTVPWIEPGRVYAGLDRLCVISAAEFSVFRCWRRPHRGERDPQMLPESWQWLNPNHVDTFDDAYARDDAFARAQMGGTFTCLGGFKSIFCRGEDRLGQLGNGGAGAPGSPIAVRGIFSAMRSAGTWHACAVALGVARGSHLICWGRDDYGQLGAPAPDQCDVDRHPVPCARTPVRGPRTPPGLLSAEVAAGDLFTCLSTSAGIECWGANRDGFFGARGSCPEELRRAWPTLEGTVPAPAAGCSTVPVDVPGIVGFKRTWMVAPRGLCVVEPDGLRCVGGLPTPRDRRIANVVLGPGPLANACGVRGGQVVCWGEGYSPSSAPDLPVPVVFEPASSGPAAVIRDPALRKCPPTSPALTTCSPGITSRAWADILRDPGASAGKIVSVRGPLGVGPLRSGDCLMEADCGGQMSADVLLGGASPPLTLYGLSCEGDATGACCSAPAYGQTVVATGRLVPTDPPYGSTIIWSLYVNTMCAAPDQTH